MYVPLKMGILFHCYVILPEGTWFGMLDVGLWFGFIYLEAPRLNLTIHAGLLQQILTESVIPLHSEPVACLLPEGYNMFCEWNVSNDILILDIFQTKRSYYFILPYLNNIQTWSNIYIPYIHASLSILKLLPAGYIYFLPAKLTFREEPPFSGDIPNKYPLCKVYIFLLKGQILPRGGCRTCFDEADRP